MNKSLARTTATAIIPLFAVTLAFAQSQAVASSGPAENGSPAWFLQGSFPDPEGSASVSADGKVTILPRGNRQQPTVIERVPNCSHSPVCGNRMTNGIVGPQQGEDDHSQRVEWKQTMGYAYTYPYAVPVGPGGMPSVALDSRGDLWVFKRTAEGTPQLYEYGLDHKLIRTVGENVIGHATRPTAWLSTRMTTCGSATPTSPQ